MDPISISAILKMSWCLSRFYQHLGKAKEYRLDEAKQIKSKWHSFLAAHKGAVIMESLAALLGVPVTPSMSIFTRVHTMRIIEKQVDEYERMHEEQLRSMQAMNAADKNAMMQRMRLQAEIDRRKYFESLIERFKRQYPSLRDQDNRMIMVTLELGKFPPELDAIRQELLNWLRNDETGGERGFGAMGLT